MNVPMLARLAALFLVGISAGCGGGAATNAATNAPASVQATPAPPSQPSYVVHTVIDASYGVSQLTLAPLGGSEPSSLQAQPVPFAVVSYPDGSVQVADAFGIVTPALGSFARANVATLETNTEAAPYVIVSDPNGNARPGIAQVDASNTNSSAVSDISRTPQNAYTHVLSGSTQVNLAAVGVHPGGINASSREFVPIEAVGIDTTGHVTSLSSATIAWAQPAAGTIVPFAGTNRALYQAPASGTGLDVLRVTVTVPGSTQAFTAGGNVAYFDVASTVSVNGKLLGSTGAPLGAGAMAAFLQRSNLPRAFHPFYWFAPAAVADGSFTRSLPKSTNFISLAAPKPSGTNTSIFLTNGPSGTPSFTSPATPSSTVSIFTLPANPARFINTYFNPLPPVASYIRDAWYSTRVPQERHIYDADSGLQPLLATPGSPPSGTVADGLFKNWKYQWSGAGSAQVLTLVEASSAGASGHRSATVALNSAAGSYHFVRYYNPNLLSLAAPLVAQQSGSLLETDGDWTQTGSITSTYTATVKQNSYNATHQTPGQPLYVQTLTYTRDSAGNIAVNNDTLVNSLGATLWIFNGTRSAYATANYGTPQQLYSYTGSLTRFYNLTTGSQSITFDSAGSMNGDGSGNVSYTKRSTQERVTYSLLATTTGSTLKATNGLVVDPTANPSTLATFTVSTQNLVQATLGADPANGFPGTAIAFTL